MKSQDSAKNIVSEDGLTIYYWIEKREGSKKPPVILHPTSSMNHSSLEGLEKELNDREYPTLIIEPRGTGISQTPARPEFFEIQRYSSDIEKILQKEDIERPILLGHSAGFMPLAHYAAKTSNSSLVIGTNASYNFRESIGTNPVDRVMFEFFDSIGRTLLEYPLSTLTRFTNNALGLRISLEDQSMLDGASEFDVLKAIVNKRYSGIHRNTVSGRAINKWDIKEQLQQLSDIPVLLIYGSQDRIIKRSTAEKMKTLILRCTVEYIDGKLSLPVTHPKRVAQAIDTYIMTPK